MEAMSFNQSSGMSQRTDDNNNNKYFLRDFSHRGAGHLGLGILIHYIAPPRQSLVWGLSCHSPLHSSTPTHLADVSYRTGGIWFGLYIYKII